MLKVIVEVPRSVDFDSADRFVLDLLESEHRYFEAGATLETVPGGTIARMPGLEPLAGGCVVQRLTRDVIEADVEGWVQRIEDCIAALGVRLARIYVAEAIPRLEDCLARRGYRRVDEVALLLRAHPMVDKPPALAGMELRRIESAADWLAKLDLHRGVTRGPDGHLSPADLWVELERRKSNCGYMTPYLVTVDGLVCGAVAAAGVGSVMRLKNLVIAPAFQRHGLGRAVAASFAGLAATDGRGVAGCFAISGTPSVEMYRSAGFHPVGLQTEWTRALTTSEGR